MALTNYCDYMLFRKAETLWNIFPLKVPPTQQHITPTLTYSQYHDTLVNVYNTGLTENELVVADYRTKCLADFVTGVTAGGVHVTGATIDCNTDIATYTNSSGGTFTLDLSCVNSGGSASYWSASSSTNYAIIPSGNPNTIVGIGTNDPMATLHVNGAGPVLDTVISASSSGNSAFLNLSGNTGSFIRLDTTEDGGLGGSNASISFRSKSTPIWSLGKNNADASASPNNFVLATGSSFDTNYIVVVTSGGSVGINTETPQRALHVQGPSSTEIPLRINTLQTLDSQTGAAIMVSTPDGDIFTAKTSTMLDIGGYWSASSVDGTFIVNSGTSANGVNENKVGIGTLSPSQPLSVSGTVSASTSFNSNLFDSQWVTLRTADTTTLVGYEAGGATYAGDNNMTAVGHRALYSSDGSPANNYNTAVGTEAMYSNNQGTFTTALGYRALHSNQSTTQHVAVGAGALLAHTSGNRNVGIGYGAAQSMSGSSSTRNVFVGHTAGPSLDNYAGTGTIARNVMIGHKAGESSNGVADSVIIGSDAAGTGSLSGDKNIIIGSSAAANATTAKRNIILGYYAADNITTADNCIIIADDTDAASISQNYQLNIGGIIQGKDLIGNDLSINSIAIGTATSISNMSKTFTVSGESLMMDHVTLPDNAKLKLGTAGDLEIYHNGSNSYIDDAGTGTIFYRSGTQTFQNAAGSKTSAVFNSGSDQELYFNNTLRFATTNTGAVVTDDLNISGDTVTSGNTSFSGQLHDTIYDMRDYENGTTGAFPTDGLGSGIEVMGQTHTSITSVGMVTTYYNGNWYATNPSSGAYVTGMTGVALSDYHGPNDRILLQGFVRVNNNLINGCGAYVSADKGRAIFPDPSTNGEYTCNQGSYTTGDYVRALGFIYDSDSTTSSYLLYINPSTDWIKLA